MASVAKRLGAAIATCGLSLAHAQGGNINLDSDIGVSLSASPTVNLTPQVPIDLTITATNFGPQRVDLLELQSSDILNQFVFVHGSADCGIGPVIFTDVSGNPTSSVLRWLAIIGPPYLNVGDTVVCHLKVTLSPNAPSNPSLTMGIPFFADINEGNDTATVHFARAAPVVSAVPSSTPAILILLALLLGTGASKRLLVSPPNYSFKRTAATGRGNIVRCAAAAA